MKSILLIVEGTLVAKIAADTAIALARSSNAEIVAQFIIDPQRLFELEGFCSCGCGGRGLCGSGVFIECEQEIATSLANLGESLLMSFAALAEGQSIKVEQYTDTGNKAQEIARRASGADLVILGETEENFEVSKGLRATVSCPVLLVQSHSQALLIEPIAQKVDLVAQLIAQLESMEMEVIERKELERGFWQVRAA